MKRVTTPVVRYCMLSARYGTLSARYGTLLAQYGTFLAWYGSFLAWNGKVRFYAPDFRRDVLWYSVVHLSICLSFCLSGPCRQDRD
jgi:hypothetical protein